MKNYLKTKLKMAIFTVLVLLNLQALGAERIKKITFIGNNRIESSTIQNYLGLKIGDEYSLLQQSEAIKKLYTTGWFEKIDIKFINDTLIVKVEEPVFVSKLVIKGNTKISNSVLMNEMITLQGEALSEARLQADVQKIKEMYKRYGRFSTQVEVKRELRSNNTAKIIFEISEGPKVGIKTIYFVGNTKYKADELKSVILTKESRWFRFLSSDDTYDPDRVEYDKNLLKSFYQSLGYADFKVISATSELAPTKEYFTVTYSIEEGDRYKLGNIEIVNKLSDVDASDLKKLIKGKTGDVFNIRVIESIAEQISNHLGSIGYPQVSVAPTTQNNSDLTVDVKFIIDHAPKVFIDRINIEGNTKTEDRVIRRELKIQEGDIFNRSYIQKGDRNLHNLDYFESVSTNIIPTANYDKYNLNINVVEKSTASVGLETGYNSVSGLFGKISFLEKNLIGSGKTLNLGVQVSKGNTNYYGGIIEPYFLDRNLSLSTNIFNNYRGKGGGFGQESQNYSLNALGTSLALGYEMGEDLNHEVEYTIKKNHLRPFSDTRSRFILEQKGRFVTSTIGHTLTYDRTDSRIVPKNGYMLIGTQELAGVGGQNKYVKHDFSARYFQSFLDNNLTFKLVGGAGNIFGFNGKMVRVSDRFTLGDYQLRGFASGGLGPRDKITKEGLGGQNYYRTSAELNFPLGLPSEVNLKGILFYDLGSVWGIKLNKNSNYSKSDFYNEKSIRASAGFGFLWMTRFAPIRVDWGFPIKKKKYDETQNFHINFTTHF